jgi:GntR family transcriptional regulator
MRLLRLDHNSPIPLHAQVERLLRDLIRRPEFQAGALLPDEVSLARRLGVSRGTLRAGIARLVYEGTLERKAGVGTRVLPRHLESGIGAWRSLAKEMARLGIKVETYHVDFRECIATREAAQALQVEDGTLLKRLDRVRGWEGAPVVHSRSWFHERLALDGTEDFTRPLYELIEAEAGTVADHAREEFMAISAPSSIARQLDVAKGAPLLLRRHTVFDPGNRPFEYAEVHYRSDRFILTLDMRREPR